MAARRIVSSSGDRSCSRSSRALRARSRIGMTRSLHTMVDRAMASTTIMPVAADSPPMKARSASQSLPAASGSATTNMSGSTAWPGKRISPATATGRTNRLMSSM